MSKIQKPARKYCSADEGLFNLDLNFVDTHKVCEHCSILHVVHFTPDQTLKSNQHAKNWEAVKLVTDSVIAPTPKNTLYIKGRRRKLLA